MLELFAILQPKMLRIIIVFMLLSLIKYFT